MSEKKNKGEKLVPCYVETKRILCFIGAEGSNKQERYQTSFHGP